MALQRDGRIVVTGYCKVDVSGTFRPRYCIARLNPDGSFDTNFDGPVASPADGRFSLPPIGSFVGNEFAYAVALQTDDRIVIAGSCPGSIYQDVCMVRLNASGTFDTTFDGPSGSGNGKVLVNLGSESIDTPRAIAIQPNGRIVVASECGFGNTSFCVVRFNENGSLDTGFGSELIAGNGGSGYVSHRFANVSVFYTPKAIAVQPDGKILASGNCSTKFCVLRLHSDGSLDTAFDGSLSAPADGFLEFAFGTGSNIATGMVLQPDGKIVVAGYCDNGTNDDFCIARLNGGPSSARQCSLDIDGDGKVLATTDSLIHARIALGLTGNAVIAGIAFPANAKRKTWGDNSASDIREYLITQCGLQFSQ
jgi:uncharacterized delta-60 repeat protein